MNLATLTRSGGMEHHSKPIALNLTTHCRCRNNILQLKSIGILLYHLDIRPSVHLLLHENGIYDVVLGVHHWLSSSRYSTQLHCLHNWTRSEWSWISWCLCWEQYVSFFFSGVSPERLYLTLYKSIVANTTSLKHRPLYTAMSGGVECIALAFGPLISGVITRYSQWRISFYIIIPVGVAVIISVFFFVNDIQRPEHANVPSRQKLKRLDVPGFVAFIPLAISVILALEWGGSEYTWTNWRIILLWVLVAVLLVIFLGIEYRSGDDSMFPLKLLYQRSVAFSALFTFCNSAALFVTAYYVSCLIQSYASFEELDRLFCEMQANLDNSFRSIFKPSVKPLLSNRVLCIFRPRCLLPLPFSLQDP